MAKSTYVYLPGLKAARERAGMLQPDLAAAIGVSRYTVAGWEQLQKRCSVGRLPEMAAILKVGVRALQKEAKPGSRSDSHHVHALKGLKAARSEAGLLQRELAAKIHIGAQEIGRWEKGERLASGVQLYALADVLGVAPERLLEDRQVPAKAAPEKSTKEKKTAPAKITYADMKPETATRSDAVVRAENYRLYYESKKNPKECECCGYPIAAHNKNSVYCYAHVSPDARRAYRERFGVAS